ncbi:MAG TPA: hypothetical protein VG458_06865, partial [Solirubrobacterales bacterium]|nr:hypothetical protein [Solirubrobacterales bacterium]
RWTTWQAEQAGTNRLPTAWSTFLLFALVALVLVAAAVATAVILATDKAAGVHIREVAGDTVDKVTSELKDLVDKNTE